MERIWELLHKRDQFLLDGETLAFIKDGKVVVLHNDGVTLSQITGDVSDKLLKELIGED